MRKKHQELRTLKNEFPICIPRGWIGGCYAVLDGIILDAQKHLDLYPHFQCSGGIGSRDIVHCTTTEGSKQYYLAIDGRWILRGIEHLFYFQLRALSMVTTRKMVSMSCVHHLECRSLHRSDFYSL